MERARLGRYELVSHLATGGMGRVSLARAQGESGFERHVVIKSLDLVDVDDTEAAAMFLDEARLLGMLHHQHVAAILEVGRDEDGRLFLVLEYVHGHNGHDVWERALDTSYQLPLDFALTVVAGAASGLHYAHTKRSPDGHRLKLVHRDVTLSNLMVGFDGAIKVIDFGIAKAAYRTTRTQTGFIKGKLGYMAPEQLRGREVDARTDVFSLGIVLYELTTMRRAFRDVSDRATVQRIKAGTYLRPSEIVPDYPPELEAIVARALDVEPEARFATADEMRRAVEALGHQLHLVIGDAPVIHVMTELFPDRAVPWQRRATTRAETEATIEVEWDPHVAPTVVATTATLDSLRAAPEAAPAAEPNGRAITEGAEQLVIDSEEVSVTFIGAPSPVELVRAASIAGVPSREITESSGELMTPTVLVDQPKAPIVVQLTPVRVTKPRVATTSVRLRAPGRGRWWIAVVAVLAGADTVPIVVVATRDAELDAPLAEPRPRASAPVVAPKPPPRPTVVAPARPASAPTIAAPTTGRFRVTSIPSDATVLLDGRRLGRTPLESELVVKPGTHVLKLRRRGYAPQRRTIELSPGAAVDEAFKLVRITPGVADN
ncbi:MAG: serine/threonine-protein kinase [Kofleriaceae bacterium]